ncbi:MAG: aerobic carbon-monoxide dehydrogenase medium subunit, partial [Alphaproteobacteria bacterium]|nr:aerobic carbon-monoxide dehydrogenase medium subunit [Alphaproteobacteria bacterium]
MKPVRFDYERPSDIATAVTLGAREDIVVKFLAGGQSLGPMLNLRLVQPDLLVDITAIAELKRIEEGADGITIGSCITHADIEDGRVPDVTRGALRAVAAGIAYRAVR